MIWFKTSLVQIRFNLAKLYPKQNFSEPIAARNRAVAARNKFQNFQPLQNASASIHCGPQRIYCGPQWPGWSLPPFIAARNKCIAARNDLVLRISLCLLSLRPAIRVLFFIPLLIFVNFHPVFKPDQIPAQLNNYSPFTSNFNDI